MASEQIGLRGERKDDHLRLAAGGRTAPKANGFDDLEFLHHALAGIDADAVDLSVRVDRWRWRTPFFINGMTGGTTLTDRVNRELAVAARETGLPMGCGSMSIALDDPAAVAGFRALREENPRGLLFANIGAGRHADDALRAVDLIEADALQLHLNAVQETVMPEGSRQFSDWLRCVEDIVAVCPVPVIVKEVGFGLSRRTLHTLYDLGVRIADVGGRGGTDFVAIENDRRGDDALTDLAGYGQSTVSCLLDAPSPSPLLFASGGVRSPLDAVKALALGARGVGVAGAFLDTALEGGAEALITQIEGWIARTRALFALLGAPDAVAVADTDILVRGRTREFCELRGISAADLSRRSIPAIREGIR